MTVLDSHRWSNDKNISFLELLLLQNANPNDEDREGNSVLNVALSKDTSINHIRILLKAGADPLHTGKDGLNAYQQAIEKGNIALFYHTITRTQKMARNFTFIN